MVVPHGLQFAKDVGCCTKRYCTSVLYCTVLSRPPSIHLPIAGFCVGPDSAMTPCLLLPIWPAPLLHIMVGQLFSKFSKLPNSRRRGSLDPRILRALFSIPFEIEAALKEVKKWSSCSKSVSRGGEVSVTSLVVHRPSILWLALDRCRRSSAVT